MKNVQSLREFYRVHFIGIGGISMNSLAKFLFYKGFSISGSDVSRNSEVEELQKLGIKVYFGHNEKNIYGADLVVHNSAIKDDNPELLRARESGVTILKRIELLRLIMCDYKTTLGVSGCHGKTTATAMLSNIFCAARLNFTAHIGGKDALLGNYYESGKDYFLTEVCEFKKNIDLINVDYACVLNVDLDHTDCYKDLSEIKAAYFRFLDRAKIRIINSDDELLSEYKSEKTITFGLKNNANYRAKSIKILKNKIYFTVFEFTKKLGRVKILTNMPCNVLNALSAIALSRQCGISFKDIKKGLLNFEGIERRNQLIGRIKGAAVIADYAHHPREIDSVLRTYKTKKKGKLYVIFQPHTYSRTRSLINDFVKSFEDCANIAIYKTYSAREIYDPNGSAYAIYKRLRRTAKYYDDLGEYYCYIKKRLTKHDTLLVLGAGEIYNEFKELLKK